MHEFHIVSWCLTDAAHRWSEEATAEHTENVLKENPQMSLGAELEGVHAPIHEIGSAAPFQPWHAQSADRDQPVPYEERDWESERERENHTRPIHPHTYTAYTDFFISVVMRIEIHQNLQAENSLGLVQDGRGVALHCQTLRKMLDFCSGFICVMVWAHVRWISQSPFSMTLWYSMPELHVENRWHVGDMSR